MSDTADKPHWSDKPQRDVTDLLKLIESAGWGSSVVKIDHLLEGLTVLQLELKKKQAYGKSEVNER